MNNKTSPYSIRQLNGRVQIIDHRDNDRIIEPDCGPDAMAYYHYIMGNFRFGSRPDLRHEYAMNFLGDIVKGNKPVTKMIDVTRRCPMLVCR